MALIQVSEISFTQNYELGQHALRLLSPLYPRCIPVVSKLEYPGFKPCPVKHRMTNP